MINLVVGQLFENQKFVVEIMKIEGGVVYTNYYSVDNGSEVSVEFKSRDFEIRMLLQGFMQVEAE